MLWRCATRIFGHKGVIHAVRTPVVAFSASSLPAIMSYAQIARGSTSMRVASTVTATAPDPQSLCTRGIVASQAGPAAISASASPSASEIVAVRRAFISGHIDLTDELFQAHYAPTIDVALAEGHHFIIGDALGADSMALEYILARGGPDVVQRITIFPSRAHNVEKLRLRGLKVVASEPQQVPQSKRSQQARGGRDASRLHHLARDARMTAASDYDILYVRTDVEAKVLYGAKWRPRVSATEMNRKRRLELAASAAASVGLEASELA